MGNTFSGSLPCELLYYSALLCYVWLNKPSSSSSSSSSSSVTTRPNFTETVTNFDRLSRENCEVSLDVELSENNSEPCPNFVPL